MKNSFLNMIFLLKISKNIIQINLYLNNILKDS